MNRKTKKRFKLLAKQFKEVDKTGKDIFQLYDEFHMLLGFNIESFIRKYITDGIVYMIDDYKKDFPTGKETTPSEIIKDAESRTKTLEQIERWNRYTKLYWTYLHNI